MNNKKILLSGAGLVGSLLAIYLAKRGYDVHVYERRSDYRKVGAIGGRSINLALSDRGLRALEAVGIKENILDIAIPMHGRMIHDKQGNQIAQAYGKEGQAINSVSRGQLNIELIKLADSYENVHFYFEQTCKSVDLNQKTAVFEDANGNKTEVSADLIIGSDGAFSAVRLALQLVADRFNYSQNYVEHGYKELFMPTLPDGGFRIEKNALHIWPRHSFMLIALPNLEGSFTCTLFMPFEGEKNAFSALKDDAEILAFFKENFPDTMPHFPNLVEDFKKNPTSALVTVRCGTWTYKENAFLIGDAAHAIVPFYGQGMNAGFEDCFVLNELMEEFNDDWAKILPAYQEARLTNGNAIADLALKNFVEMRDKVADPKFLLRKKIEAHLFEKHPEKWTPQYSLVTFSHTPYRTAWNEGLKQDAIMEKIMDIDGIDENWANVDYLPFLA